MFRTFFFIVIGGIVGLFSNILLGGFEKSFIGIGLYAVGLIIGVLMSNWDF